MKTTSSRIRAYLYACIYLSSFISSDLLAATLYWDANGTNLGAGSTPTGTWGTDSYWNTDSAGGAGTFTTMLGATLAAQKLNIASFSAGTDAVNPYTVTVNGTQGAMGINFVDGATTLTGGTISLAYQVYGTAPTNGNATIVNETSTTGTSVIDSNIAVGTGAQNSSLYLIAKNGTADLDLQINGTISRTGGIINTYLYLGGDGNGEINSNLGSSMGLLEQGGDTWSGTWSIKGNQDWITGEAVGRINLLASDSFGTNAKLVMGTSLSDVQKMESISVTNSNPQLIINSTMTTTGSLVVSGNTEMQIPGYLSVGANTLLTSSKLTLSDGVTAGTYKSTGSVTGTSSSIVGGSPNMSTIELTNGLVEKGVPFGGTGTYDNNIQVVKNTVSNMDLFNVSTYTGDTLVNAGSLTLRTHTTLGTAQIGDTDTKVATGATFTMEDNTRYNMVVDGLTSTTITGTGTVALSGDFNFNLASAALAWGNTWQVVANSTLTETYGSTFNVVGFTQLNNVWTKPVTLGSTVGYWQFSEATGVLSLIPEPSTFTFTLMSSLLLIRRRREIKSFI